MYRYQSQSGFTIIELMITVVIIAIAAMIATPQLRNANLNSELSNSAREFVSMLQLARSEAIKRNNVVSIETQSATADDFSTELLVCTGDSGCDKDNTIKSYNIGNGTVTFNSSIDTRISYDSRGYLVGRTDIGVGVCFEGADPDRFLRKYITISKTGRPILQTYDEDNGQHSCTP